MQTSELPEIDFGTSGLRGPATGFSAERVAAYVGAFLDEIVGNQGIRTLVVGADFRSSSPAIMNSVIAAATAKNWHCIYAGNVPTPALALYALENGLPGFMVTGSHIPPDYNGIKFYRPDGELLKQDEAPIRVAAQRLMQSQTLIIDTKTPLVDGSIAERYRQRYLDVFSADALAGMRIGVDQHSAVGRDLLVDVLEALGAMVRPFRRSEAFIAVDTEALDVDDLKRAVENISDHNLDAVVSTDGDGDRPLMIDETGQQVNGDVLGALTAKSLNIDTVVTPLSSTTAIEQSGWFSQVIRTKIGSPHVVAAMADANTGATAIAGFEANGGFLTETDIQLTKGKLSRLPTRDALLPLVTVLAEANRQKRKLSEFAADLPSRFMQADRIKQVDPVIGRALLEEIARSDRVRAQIDDQLKNPLNIDTLDGTRLTFSDATIVHFRQSGNAPEMRCYVETESADKTRTVLARMIDSLGDHLFKKGNLR